MCVTLIENICTAWPRAWKVTYQWIVFGREKRITLKCLFTEYFQLIYAWNLQNIHYGICNEKLIHNTGYSFCSSLVDCHTRHIWINTIFSLLIEEVNYRVSLHVSHNTDEGTFENPHNYGYWVTVCYVIYTTSTLKSCRAPFKNKLHQLILLPMEALLKLV